MLKPVEEGQVIYVSSENMFFPKEPMVTPYIITKFNQSSFYARPVDIKTIHEWRFSRKKWVCDNGIGDFMRAYETEEQYWNIIQKEQERKERRERLLKYVKEADGKTLRQLEEFINQK